MTTQEPPDLDLFSSLRVSGGDGIQHTMAEFWKEQLAAFVFVRQFG
jgi:hypothetical protein